MNLFEIALLTLALSFDLSGICFASGTLLRKADVSVSLRFLLILVITQVMLSFAGLMAGLALFSLIGQPGQWIAFLLFTGIGLKILFESFQPNPGDSTVEAPEVKSMIIQALAEGLNAFIITTGIGFLAPDIPKTLLLIGILLFLLCAVWLYIGRMKDTYVFKFRLGIAGGLIMVAAGLHVFIKLIG